MDPKSETYARQIGYSGFEQKFIGYTFKLYEKARWLICEYEARGILLEVRENRFILKHVALLKDPKNKIYNFIPNGLLNSINILLDGIFNKLKYLKPNSYLKIFDELDELYSILKNVETQENMPFKSLVKNNTKDSYIKLIYYDEKDGFDLYCNLNIPKESSETFEISYDAESATIMAYSETINDVEFKDMILNIQQNKEAVKYTDILRYMQLLKFERRAEYPKDGERGEYLYNKYKTKSPIHDNIPMYNIKVKTTYNGEVCIQLCSKVTEAVIKSVIYSPKQINKPNTGFLASKEQYIYRMRKLAFLVGINNPTEAILEIAYLLKQ